MFNAKKNERIKRLETEVKWLRTITDALGTGGVWVPENAPPVPPVGFDTPLMLTCSRCGLDLGPRMVPEWGKEE